MSVVLGGTTDALDALDAAGLVANVPVGDLESGTHEVEPILELPDGVEVLRHDTGAGQSRRSPDRVVRMTRAQGEGA